ncbi:MAG: nitroreductase [Peptostreptococcales bacterium]|jgi:nitroreductase
MEIMNAIEKRKSVRGYLDKPVSKETISKIIETSLRSPSAVNIQPWDIYVVTGEVLDNMKNENEKMFLSGAKPTREEPNTVGVFKERRVELAKELFKVLDIQREDQEKRRNWTAQGFRYFNAPVALIITTKKNILEGTWGLLGIGSIIQTICLAAMEYDLATCIGEQGVFYQDVLRKHLAIPEDEDVVISISLGYEDLDFPANQLISSREPLHKVTKWFGF